MNFDFGVPLNRSCVTEIVGAIQTNTRNFRKEVAGEAAGNSQLVKTETPRLITSLSSPPPHHPGTITGLTFAAISNSRATAASGQGWNRYHGDGERPEAAAAVDLVPRSMPPPPRRPRRPPFPPPPRDRVKNCIPDVHRRPQRSPNSRMARVL
ncbi:hypothetical protein J6590_010841 [Homalodisca vitripennis]|nr:hypothetical protein J6590_010841 [Homalodisca vitripennis]